MDNAMALQLVKTGEFEGVRFNCYQDSSKEFWGTREQIGAMLGYADPMRAIAHIHERNPERLDKFSTVVKLSTVEGERNVTRNVTVYNFKGLLEICRYSDMPKANAVMDFLWDIADEIRRTGTYMTLQKLEDVLYNPDLLIRLGQLLKEEQAKNAALSAQLESRRSKPSFYTPEEAARELGYSGYRAFYRGMVLMGLLEQKSQGKGHHSYRPTFRAERAGILRLYTDERGCTRPVVTESGLMELRVALWG